MKKKIKKALALFFALSMAVMPVRAADNQRIQVDGSYLTHDTASRGTTSSGVATRGKHMMDGLCSITKAGLGKIAVYASTTGNHDLDFLSVVIHVERYNTHTEQWGLVDSWQAKDYNTYYVSTSKTMSVYGGFYYRVRAEHVAGMNSEPYDYSYSYTDGIYVS